MDQKKKMVLFDTNAYRQFVMGKTRTESIAEIGKIRELEDQKGITARAIMIVAMEMLANLAEGEKGFNYEDCLNGSLVMITHCIDAEGRPNIIPQPYLHLCHAFFGRIPADIEQKTKNLVGVAHDLQIDLDKTMPHHIEKNTFEDIKQWTEQEEEQFCENIINLVEGAKMEVRHAHPNIADRDLRMKTLELINSKKFDATLSYAIMLKTAETLDFKLTEAEIWDRANTLVDLWPMAVGFFKWICHEIVDKNIDMRSKTSKEKRWNWQWDYQVSFLVSEQTIAEHEVLLVTSDKDLTKILAAYGFEDRVMTLSAYIAYLNIKD